MPVHDRTSFEKLYAGQPRWEIGRPQQALLAVADRIAGAVSWSALTPGVGVALLCAGKKLRGRSKAVKPEQVTSPE